MRPECKNWSQAKRPNEELCHVQSCLLQQKNDQAKKTTQQDFNNETPFSPHLSQIRIRGRTPGGADDGVGVRAGGAEVVPAIVTSDLLKNSHSHIPNHAPTCCGPARVHWSTCGGRVWGWGRSDHTWRNPILTNTEFDTKNIMSAVYHLPNELGVRLSLWKLTHLIRLSKISKFCNLAFFKYPPAPLTN